MQERIKRLMEKQKVLDAKRPKPVKKKEDLSELDQLILGFEEKRKKGYDYMCTLEYSTKSAEHKKACEVRYQEVLQRLRSLRKAKERKC